ncbi:MULTISPECIES: LysR family transcriptional regulator [unclassified Hahella]|uniref:LysR family transcriptional regulator n=1 Tax=unclassified Hahella TaxID=2624107 RepID=UPI001C1E9CA1|nr:MULTISPECIES: LysR family transcriptional regulator [unclassified Hahella]MBU6952274.1 LysR family transcriptional regulator [Hahella sp. HN01]MDG9667622.1 LysR family transcriptional regulator [Hahella sp. CR1]
MNVSLRQLRVFEATARLGRLTLAAEEQCLSQSAASQSIREMEKALGYAVLNKVGRELELSDAGRRVLPRVRRILGLVDGLALPDIEKVAGPLRVAASVTIASYLLPSLLAEFVKRYPEVEPDLQIQNTETVLALLEKGRAHIGMIEGPALHPTLHIAPWQSDRLAIFCATGHPLTQVDNIGVEALEQFPWIVRETGSGTRAVFDAAMQAMGVRPRIALALSRQEAIKQSVRAGLGVGCLSGLSIVDEVREGLLVELSTPLNLTRQFSWIISPDNRESTVVKAFIALLQEREREANRHPTGEGERI